MNQNSRFNPSSHRSGKSLKFLRSWRGSAILRFVVGEIDVRFEASEYEERGRTSVTGVIDADLTGREDAEKATLVFQDGETLEVQLVDPSDEGADFRSVTA